MMPKTNPDYFPNKLKQYYLYILHGPCPCDAETEQVQSILNNTRKVGWECVGWREGGTGRKTKLDLLNFNFHFLPLTEQIPCPSQCKAEKEKVRNIFFESKLQSLGICAEGKYTEEEEEEMR
jgi:hypothetical protein